tara:strand:- start:611 stop:865 length:255 start_codon:yes stop_codon:yes gene_type:complete
MKMGKNNMHCTLEGCNNELSNPTHATKYCDTCKVEIRKKQSSDFYLRSRNGLPATRGCNANQKPVNPYFLKRGKVSIYGGKLFG